MDELTAMAVKRVLGLRNGKVGLSDAVLAVEEFTNDAVGLCGGSTEGGEGEFALVGQRWFSESRFSENSPKRLGGTGSLSHGGQGDETDGVMHDGGADWGWSGPGVKLRR